MKAISLHQYWPSLIAVAVPPTRTTPGRGKLIETRSFLTRYRGPLAIHAGGKLPGYAKDCYADEDSKVTRAILREDFGVRRKDELCMLPRGCVQVVVDLVEVVRITSANLSVPRKYQTPGWLEFGNYEVGRFMWFLENIRRLPKPVECKGQQGFWPLPDDIVNLIEGQIGEVRTMQPRDGLPF